MQSWWAYIDFLGLTESSKTSKVGQWINQGKSEFKREHIKGV